MKRYVYGLITGLLIAGSIGVYASYKYNASDVSYKDSDVESAIEEISEKVNKPDARIIPYETYTFNNAKFYALSEDRLIGISADGDNYYPFAHGAWPGSGEWTNAFREYRGFAKLVYIAKNGKLYGMHREINSVGNMQNILKTIAPNVKKAFPSTCSSGCTNYIWTAQPWNNGAYCYEPDYATPNGCNDSTLDLGLLPVFDLDKAKVYLDGNELKLKK